MVGQQAKIFLRDDWELGENLVGPCVHQKAVGSLGPVQIEFPLHSPSDTHVLQNLGESNQQLVHMYNTL